MAGGITENDVWTASDALLLEGARPTIERVRQKIGRGSPNTVSPYLDTWFKNLGGRIADPGTFSAQLAPPDPIVQAATHFWEMARVETRRDFDARLSTAMAEAMAQVKVEKNRAVVAEIAAFDATSQAERLATQLREHADLLEQGKLTAARTAAHLADAQRQIDDLSLRLSSAQTELRDVRETSRQEVAAAVDHFNGAARRALLDMDAERTLRSKAEKRAELLERKVESTVADARAAQSRAAQELVTAQADAARLARELEVASMLADGARLEAERLAQKLLTEQRASEHARGEASVARSMLTQFGKASGRAALRKRQSQIKSSA